MKLHKILLITALAVLIAAFAASCSGGVREFDPDLGVIVDENLSSTTKADIDDFYVTVECDEALGAVSSRKSGNAIICDAMPGKDTAFLGWYANEDMAGEPIATGTTVSLSPELLSTVANDGRVTLYAKLCLRFDITYELGGGRFVGTGAPDHYLADGTETELPYGVQKDGCTFAGWRISATGQTVSSIPRELFGDVTLSAVWDKDDEDLGAFENTVWSVSLPEAIYDDFVWYFFFSPDGALDIFSGSEGYGLVNSGAVFGITHRFLSEFPNGGTVSTKALAEATAYDASVPYYTYERTDSGAVMRYNSAAFDPGGSFLYNINALVLGDDFFVEFIARDGGAVMAVNIPKTVDYCGTGYTAEQWQQYVASVGSGSIDRAAIKYSYEKTELPFVLEQQAQRVTDHSCNVLCPYLAPDRTYNVSGAFVLEGTNVAISESGLFRPIFMRGDEILGVTLTVDFLHLAAYYVYPMDVEKAPASAPQQITLPDFTQIIAP